MNKSRSFSIYLLKEGFNSSNALKEDHSLGEPVHAANLPKGATLYLRESEPIPPWWKSFWGISQDLYQSSAGAVIFLPVDGRHFVLTFGHAYHDLKDESYVYDFGLRVTLNSLDPQKLKSTDILSPAVAKRQRIQSPIGTDLTYFDFDKDSTILKTLTGKVKNEYKELFRNATGASNLKISSKASPDGILKLCRQAYDVYRKDDYKESFPDVQNISPIKDPATLRTLDKKLLDVFNEGSKDLVLAIPEIIDFQDNLDISFSGLGSSPTYEDVFIGYYRDYLKNANNSIVSIETLKSHQLHVCDENGIAKKSFSVYKCLLFDGEVNNVHFHLCEGNWYQVEKEYIKRLSLFLDPLFANIDFPDFNHESENAYNLHVANNNKKYVCLDKTSIAPSGQTGVEPCDLYCALNGYGYLYHVKISTRSSSLSHLFNQGVNAVELMKLDEASQTKMVDLIKKNLNGNDETTYATPIKARQFKVTYVIATHKDGKKKSANLPLFSRISLMRCMKSLILMSVESTICFVNDVSEKKEKKNPRKKTIDR